MFKEEEVRRVRMPAWALKCITGTCEQEPKEPEGQHRLLIYNHRYMPRDVALSGRFVEGIFCVCMEASLVSKKLMAYS